MGRRADGEARQRNSVPREIILAHDLQNLAHRLTLMTESLEQGGASASGTHEVLRQTVAELGRIARELRSGNDGTAVAPLDLNRVLRDALERTAHRRRPDSTVVERFEALPPVDGNATLLGGAFSRAIENALDALGAGGVLTVSTAVRATGGASSRTEVLVEIVDDGKGMSPRFVEERLFAHDGTDGRGQGAWAYRAVALRAGGNVQVESAEGSGTRVRFRFPPSTDDLRRRDPDQGQVTAAAAISASRSPTCPEPNDS